MTILSNTIAVADAWTVSPPYTTVSAYTQQYVGIAPQNAGVQAHLFGRISPDWEVVRPLPINLEQDDNGVHVVSDDLFLVYGDGKDQLAAICNYVEALIKLYQLIRENAPRNEYDKIQLDALARYIRTAPAR